MKNIAFVKVLQSDDYLDQSFPDGFLIKMGTCFLMLHDLLVEVAII